MTEPHHYLKQLIQEFKDKDDERKILLYGCNGYTAKLVLQLIRDLDFPMDRCVFAARNPTSLTESLVANLGDKYERVLVVAFSATESEVDRILNHSPHKFSVVLNCAGPFEETARPFIMQCARAGVSYLDITGEVPIFEFAHNNPALKKLVDDQPLSIIPGVGFDVVPSDCILKTCADEYEKKYGEKAHSLDVMIVALNASSGTGISHGTKKTMIRGLSKGGSLTRRDGVLQTPNHWVKNFTLKKSKDAPYSSIQGSSIPWGDISTAYYSTGVPNIHTYMPGIYSSERVARTFNSSFFGFLMRLIFALPFSMSLVDHAITKWSPAGPSEEDRSSNTGVMYCVASGKPSESEEKRVAKHLFLTEGYRLTAESALASTLRVALGKVNAWGCKTPSLAFGSDYITNFDNCFFEDETDSDE